MSIKKNILSAFRALRTAYRRLRCAHEWTLYSRERYSVNRGDGSKEGEVTLTLLECRKCGADKLIASDRTHLPRA